MKKIALAFISVTIMAGSFAQTVFTYGKNAVTKDEFENAFNKNPNPNADRKAALQEYLNLYINFKLKVQAALDAGLDKDPTQQYELQNFKAQVADNIISDQANVKELVKEAFERSQKEINLAQVFIEVPDNADTADAYKRIQAAYKELKDGKDFSIITQQYSTDLATKQSKGALGYITVFTLPYDLENIAYSLKVNGFSAPVKTRMGYHIFKNAGERKPVGSRKVAQILVSYAPDATAEDKMAAGRKADSLYNLLQQGVMFEGLVAIASNDLSSANNKGELPEFTAGTYSADFENVAFALKNPGDVSKPFQTTHGYHILKLLEAKPVSTDVNDAAYLAALQEKVIKDSRMNRFKNDLIDKKLALIKYKPAVFKANNLYQFTDSALTKSKALPVKGITGNTPLFSFATHNVKAADWLNFVRTMRNDPNQNATKSYADLYKEYIRIAADDYYRKNLQLYDAGYSKQVKEFKEANLLFGIMERNVWGKANVDTSGLRQYYNQHKSKYAWSPSADAIIVTCPNQKVSETLQQKLKDSLGYWREITANYTDVVADSGRYELGQLPVVDRTNFTAGLITAPVKNDNDGTVTFNYVINVYPHQGQRNFDDARGMVISDYQQVLEDKWIADLKKKYPVVINQALFKTIK
ncbi:MAG: hypothetical protein JWQ40_4707 [Segetibacter sp.]|nr:hypothetical protein [Segetibacter sp.]